MPANPFTDVWSFLTANTSDYLHQGNWRYLILVLFWALLLVSIAVAIQNWRDDPAQRSGRHVGIWLARVLIGCLWFQGMLWKLPLFWIARDAAPAHTFATSSCPHTVC